MYIWYEHEKIKLSGVRPLKININTLRPLSLKTTFLAVGTITISFFFKFWSMLLHSSSIQNLRLVFSQQPDALSNGVKILGKFLEKNGVGVSHQKPKTKRTELGKIHHSKEHQTKLSFWNVILWLWLWFWAFAWVWATIERKEKIDTWC